MLTTVLFFFVFIASVQEIADEERKPEWGVELTSELQMTQEGETNLANVLRMQASIPVSRSLSGYSWKNGELGLFTDYAHFDGCEEFATELTCKLQLTPIISVQPTTHFIITSTPFTSGKEFTFAAALRLGIAI